MCFRRPASSKDKEEVLLAPRPVLKQAITPEADAQYKRIHNVDVFEAHLQHQNEINAALDEDDIVTTHELDYNQFTMPDTNNPTIPNTEGPPTISLTLPQPHKHAPPSHQTTTSPPHPSILLNRDAPTNILHILSPSVLAVAQSDPPTLAKLTGRQASPCRQATPAKPLSKQQKYTILPTRPLHSQPPHLDYTRYEIWDRVQKENFSIGGKDLEWKTGVVDLRIEADLLDDYIGWVRDRHEELRIEGDLIKEGKIEGGKGYKRVNRHDRRFFAELENSLRGEFRQTARETYRLDERWGKEEEDSRVIWDLVERLEMEEGERKAAEKMA